MIQMREFNYFANFVIFLAPIWAVLSPRIPVRLYEQFILLALSFAAIWNIEVTHTLNLSMSGMMLKGAICYIFLRIFWMVEEDHLKLFFWPLIESCKKWLWWIK